MATMKCWKLVAQTFCGWIDLLKRKHKESDLILGRFFCLYIQVYRCLGIIRQSDIRTCQIEIRQLEISNCWIINEILLNSLAANGLSKTSILHDIDKLTLHVLVYLTVFCKSLAAYGMSTNAFTRFWSFTILLEVAYKGLSGHVAGGDDVNADFLFDSSRNSYQSKIPVNHRPLWVRYSTIESEFVKGTCCYWLANIWCMYLFHLL